MLNVDRIHLVAAAGCVPLPEHEDSQPLSGHPTPPTAPTGSLRVANCYAPTKFHKH